MALLTVLTILQKTGLKKCAKFQIFGRGPEIGSSYLGSPIRNLETSLVNLVIEKI